MMQEDRSQHRNRAKAMAVLRTRLYDFERQKLDAARAAERRGQVGTGDRSERIRTYNFPQGRVSDHRINLTLYKLPQIMEGEALGEIIDALVAEHQAALLAAEETRDDRRQHRQRRSARRDGADRCRLSPSAARSGGKNFAPPASICPNSTPAFSSATRSGSITPRWLRPGRAPSTPRASKAIAALARAPAGARAGRAHRRQQGILEPELRVNAATLVPRPETETVVEAALAAIDAHGPRTRALRIADLGTGSGALLLALLTELPNAFGVGTDTSLGALAIARDNARRLGLPGRHSSPATWRRRSRGPFDLIVSNPPYIASSEIAALAPEVRDFDPRPALDGGPDGLDFYRSDRRRGARAACSPAARWSSNSASARRRRSPPCLSGRGLAPSPPRPDLSGVPRALAADELP